MNPLEVLGKKFEEVKDSFRSSGVLDIYDELEEGDEQEYCVKALDESWEFLIESDHTIKTIFLFLSNGYGHFNGISSSTTKKEVIRKLGKPTKQGEAQEISILGNFGAWERYDRDEYALHIEHSAHSDTIVKITLMLLRVAP